jgi:hypothetical protein
VYDLPPHSRPTITRSKPATDSASAVPESFAVSALDAAFNIPRLSLVCQAFKDCAGTIRLGESFNVTSPPTPISTTAKPVQIGSIFCSDAAGLETHLDRSAKHQSLARAVKPSARVQVNFAGRSAVQIEVPVDNSIARVVGTSKASSAFILATTSVKETRVSCQAWKDTLAKQKLGKPFTFGQAALFSDNGADVPIGALKCTLSKGDAGVSTGVSPGVPASNGVSVSDGGKVTTFSS